MTWGMLLALMVVSLMAVTFLRRLWSANMLFVPLEMVTVLPLT